jgi:hypothetical protein
MDDDMESVRLGLLFDMWKYECMYVYYCMYVCMYGRFSVILEYNGTIMYVPLYAHILLS